MLSIFFRMGNSPSFEDAQNADAAQERRIQESNRNVAQQGQKYVEQGAEAARSGMEYDATSSYYQKTFAAEAEMAQGGGPCGCCPGFNSSGRHTSGCVRSEVKVHTSPWTSSQAPGGAYRNGTSYQGGVPPTPKPPVVTTQPQTNWGTNNQKSRPGYELHYAAKVEANDYSQNVSETLVDDGYMVYRARHSDAPNAVGGIDPETGRWACSN